MTTTSSAAPTMNTTSEAQDHLPFIYCDGSVRRPFSDQYGNGPPAPAGIGIARQVRLGVWEHDCVPLWTQVNNYVVKMMAIARAATLAASLLNRGDWAREVTIVSDCTFAIDEIWCHYHGIQAGRAEAQTASAAIRNLVVAYGCNVKLHWVSRNANSDGIRRADHWAVVAATTQRVDSSITL